MTKARSKEHKQLQIQGMKEIREWRSALGNAQDPQQPN